MKLHLKRPLAFFDLETTGINISSDRIVEISILKVMPDGQEAVETIKINPGMPIPIESSLIHGIYDADVKDAPTFKSVAADLAAFIGDSDLAGYNSNKFDIPMLMEEFLRVGVDFSLDNRYFVDVQNIFHQMEQRTLKAAYKFYCGEVLDNAHSAEVDVKATYEVLKAQLSKYENVSWEDKSGKVSTPVVNDVPALHTFTNLSKPVDFAGRIVYNEKGVEVLNFGKHKGKPLEEIFAIEPSYYSWMMQGDFPLYTKKCLDVIWKRFRAKQKEQKVSDPTPHAPKDRKPTSDRPTDAFKKEGHFKKENNFKQGGPNYRQNNEKKKATPITDDMLKNLQDKFGKK